MKKHMPQAFSAGQKGSFAEFTVQNRFPKIFKEVCPDDYEEFIQSVTVRAGIKDGEHPGLTAMRNAVMDYADKTLADFFYTAPFFLVEMYFYHLLLCRQNYGKRGFDFFASKKDASYKDKQKEYSEKLERLFLRFEKQSSSYSTETRKNDTTCTEIKNILRDALGLSLRANSGDLSQIHEIKPDTVKYLCDETDVCTTYITKCKSGRFDVICDNSGSELFSDIYLAVFFIKLGFAQKVILHVNPCPFFVSDATLDDFSKLLNMLTKDGKNSELTELLHQKKIAVEADEFWVEPYYFDAMPPKLHKHFEKSDLVIVKGDLNYRRLVGDYAWDFTEKFTAHVLLKTFCGKTIPLITPRVLKSDLLIGIDPIFEAAARNADSAFRTNGKWGVIHTTLLPRVKLLCGGSKTQQGDNREKLLEKKSAPVKAAAPSARIGEVAYAILFALIGTMCVCVLAVAAITFIKALGSDETPRALLERMDFSVILSALTLLLGGTVILPKFLLKSEVKNAVKEEVEIRGAHIVKAEAEKYISDKIQETKNEANKMGAHFSRMIAFFLSTDYPIWSVGWAFRSLKCYETLDEHRGGLKEYVDFINFIKESILVSAIQKLNEKLAANESPYKILQAASAVSEERNPERPVIRAIKYIADLEYLILFNGKKDDEKKLAVLSPVCRAAGNFARFLCIVLMAHRTSVYREINDKEEPSQWLSEEILQISNFDVNSLKQDDASEIVHQQDFANRLKKTLASLPAKPPRSISKTSETYFFEQDKKDSDTDRKTTQHKNA